ncbi:MAG: hypothetical protein QNJ46_09320 [Leptolyngbyaceae cyanobacterium MO_188.B28]|nr:hypothetical protein [Leptolyngbyaceae cyanobacterium MO_188.B28]
MRKLMHPTAVISILLLSLSMGGCFWNPPELSLAEAEGGEFEAGAEGEGEGGEFEAGAEGEGEGGEFEAGAEGEGEGGEFEARAEGEGEGGEFEARAEGEGEGGEFEARAEGEGEGGEAELVSRAETGATSIRGNYTLEFSKTSGQSACAQFGEILDMKVSADGLMTGYLYFIGSRGGPFSGRVRPNGEWSAIGPDEGYKFEGNIRDEEVSGEYSAPAPNPTEGESTCEGTVEGFKLPD